MTKQEKSFPRGSVIFTPRKIRVKVVGLGGGGASIVSEIARSFKNANFLVADTDIKTIQKIKKGIKFFQFGEKITGGSGTGVNPDVAREAALNEKEKIAKILENQDLLILIGSLGGGVCSGAGPIFAEIAKNKKCISLGIFTLPFGFEGDKKMAIAKKAAALLKDCLSGIIIVPNEKILQITDKRLPLKKSLSVLNQTFAGWLQDLLFVILKPSLINIDFADLRTILKDKGNVLFFSEGTGQGPNRAEEALKNLFQNILFENQPFIAKRVLFNIAGSKDLKLKEVEIISAAIANCNPRAKIIFGITDCPSYRGKIKIILLAVIQEKQEIKEKKAEKEEQSSAPRKHFRHKEEKEQNKKEGALKKEKPAKEKQNFRTKREKIRRTALEIQKEEEDAQQREWIQEPDWEIPAFLRKKENK